MKNSIRRCFFLLLAITTLFSSVAVAQEKLRVSGVVKDSETGEPLIGATVIAEDESGAGAITDADGRYILTIDSGATLSFSYVGYTPQNIVVNKKKIDVSLVAGLELDDVVVIGYGTVKKKEMTGAATQVKAEDLENTVSSDLGMALQGLVAGVNVTSSAGDPGSVANILIRGVSSISGSNTPLFVVDGIPQEGNPSLSSSEIETIDILKDAASCAIYGTRGAAGVIIITTKQGKEGKMKVDFSAIYGMQDINYEGLPDVMNLKEQVYVDYVYSAYLLGKENYDTAWSSNMLDKPERYLNDTDAISLVLKDGIRPEQTYNITLSGGTKELSYSSTLGYYNQDGLLMNSGFQRYSMRNNFAYRNDKVTLSIGTSFSIENQQKASGDSFSTALSYEPYLAAVDRETTEFYVITTNEAKQVQSLVRQFQTKQETETNKSSINLGIDYKLTSNLTLNSKFGLNSSDAYAYKFNPKVNIYVEENDWEAYNTSSISTVTNTTTKKLSLSWHGGLTYSKTFKKDHDFTATAVASYEQYSGKGYFATQEDIYTTTDDAVLDMGTGEALVGSNNYYTDRLFGTIGRVQYSYKERYMLSASVRADASSKFSADNRWGIFPSISAGWNVSDEKFWGNAKKTINSFKVRASHGTTGNQNFDSYSYSSYISSGYDYVYEDGTLSSGNTSISYSNANVKWETSIQTNLGIDLAFFNNKFTFNGDIYNTNKRDMLAEVLLPTSSGTTTLMVQNIGNMNNKGIELNIGYNKKFENFRFGASINYSKNVNEITSLSDSNSIIYATDSKVVGNSSTSTVAVFTEGYEAGAFFLYKTVGVIKTDEQLAEYQAIEPSAKLGDMMFQNTNEDGVISTEDRVYCGSGSPEYEVGVNLNLAWKNFDFSTQIYASVGNEMINGPEYYAVEAGRSASLVYQWSPQNPDSDIPYNDYTDGSYKPTSDMWLEDASFVRVKNLSIGYTLPEKLTSTLGMSSIKAYITGQNLFTLTGYNGMDPEVGGNGLTTCGIDKGGYPLSKKVMIGLKVQF